MRFHFPFEHVLEFRKEAENRARLDYSDSLGKLEDEKQQLKKIYEDMDAAADEIFALQSQQSNSLSRIDFLNDFIDGQKAKSEQKRLIIRNLKVIVEQKYEILLGAIREYEVIKKLKSKKMEAFKKEMKKRELKSNDEIVVTRYKRTGGGI